MNSDNLPEVQEHPKARLSAIWILPIVAALIGGWLIYKAIVDAPIQITVSFDSGEGIAAGKTEVKYEGVLIGKVSDIIIQPDLVGVTATIDMDKRAARGLLSNTQFWLVKPEVSLSGISGLGTVLSGNYITLRVGDGKPATNFIALASPPAKSLNDPGLHLVLNAKDLGSLSVGSPVIYKKFEIGNVQFYKLDADGANVSINLFIKPEFMHLVRSNSRFWNASGISIKGGLTGFDIRTESLTSILKGGIGVTPIDDMNTGDAANNSDEYVLFDDYVAAKAGILVNVDFPIIAGIEAGVTDVVYRGITIGQVQEVDINQSLTVFKATIALPPRAAKFINKNTRFWIRQPQISMSNLSGVGSLLSGTQIELDIDGEGPDTVRNFVALKKAPILKQDAPGLHLTLNVEALKSVSRGMKILYRSIAVGSILDYRLSDDNASIELDAHIEPEYVHLVNSSTRFWDASGIEVNGGLNGLKIRTASLSSIILGAISFYTPETGAAIVNEDAHFRLFSDYDSAHSVGIPIIFHFDEGDGLKEGTAIKYEGIAVGTVNSVSLNKSLDGVVVKATLKESAREVAKADTQFWLVKPELGLTRTANLGTLLTGEYITFKLGGGKAAFSFTALKAPPVVQQEKRGLNIVLTSGQRSSVKKGVSVSYRGVVVGKVTGLSLANSADHVRIYVNIEEQYQPLVRANSKFWNASGLDIGFKLFGGAKIKSDSVESILGGGISFATPGVEEMGGLAEEGDTFSLHSSRNDAWIKWQPKIPLELDGDEGEYIE